MIDFFKNLIELLTNIIGVLGDTANRIDEVTFDDSLFKQYLGYAKYVMGTSLFTVFTSSVLIAIGVSMWTYLIKGVFYIRSLL